MSVGTFLYEEKLDFWYIKNIAKQLSSVYKENWENSSNFSELEKLTQNNYNQMDGV